MIPGWEHHLEMQKLLPEELLGQNLHVKDFYEAPVYTGHWQH